MNKGLLRGLNPETLVPPWMGGGDPGNDGFPVLADSSKPGGAKVAAVPGQILASKWYNPSSQVVASTTSSTFSDIDATNLAVTFTGPPSGFVIVTLTSRAYLPASNWLQWNLRDSNGNVSGTDGLVLSNDQNSETVGGSVTRRVKVAVTPGTSYTWKWGQASLNNSSSLSTVYGGSSGGSGGALMEVVAA